MLLDDINIPKDLKKLSPEQLPELCRELRRFISQTTRRKAGHIKASLGVTELTVALHYLLDTPSDILVWDVGHQAYVHKVLTGRKNLFHTNRIKGGLSGFTSRRESEYDPFGAGHSSTSISAVAGFAEADKLSNVNRRRVAVIGDGALTGGMSFEALNYAGERQLDMLVVLNDNHQSIDDNRGALARYERYENYFSSLGFDFLGSVESSDIASLLPALKSAISQEGPRCIRIVSDKRKEEIPSEEKRDQSISFQEVFGNSMLNLAEAHSNMVVLSPAMLSGAGLLPFAEKFPERVFDVGIAEQHVVTMAAAMSASGMLPVIHLYSTFAQRAYDQIIHDLALQGLHAVICLDRSGLVGEDGATHHGNFDLGFMNTIPGVRILAPMNGNELESCLNIAMSHRAVWVIRYPKASTTYEKGEQVSPFLNEIQQGKEKVILSCGAIGEEVRSAVSGLPYACYSVAGLKPLPSELKSIVASFSKVICVEEGSPRGGFGDAVRAIIPSHVDFTHMSLPDKFIEHGSRQELLKLCGLDESSLRNSFIRA